MNEFEYEPNPMLQNIVKHPKKPNKLLIILVSIIIVLLIIVLVLLVRKPQVITTETLREQSLDEVAVELEYFIDENHLDALDAYGYDDLTRVAINHICTGVYNCNEISGDEVKEYIKNNFDKEVTLSNVNCELNDGVLYTYDSEGNKFVLDSSHMHGGIGTEDIYTKVNSIKRDGNKILLVLNKLYFNPLQSNYITTDPLGINRVYDSKDYMHTTESGQDIDLTKLSANYENQFDDLKNIGTRYSYTFSKKDGHYVLEKYEVINDEE